MDLVRDQLLVKLVELVSLEPVSSTSIRLEWKLLADVQYLHGFYIRLVLLFAFLKIEIFTIVS